MAPYGSVLKALQAFEHVCGPARFSKFSVIHDVNTEPRLLVNDFFYSPSKSLLKRRLIMGFAVNNRAHLRHDIRRSHEAANMCGKYTIYTSEHCITLSRRHLQKCKVHLYVAP